jgi:hypothetical protein
MADHWPRSGDLIADPKSSKQPSHGVVQEPTGLLRLAAGGDQAREKRDHAGMTVRHPDVVATIWIQLPLPRG